MSPLTFSWHSHSKMDDVKEERDSKSCKILKFSWSHTKNQCSIDSHCSRHVNQGKAHPYSHLCTWLRSLMYVSGFLSSSWHILHNEASTGLGSQQKYHLYMPSTDFSFWDSLDRVLHHNCAGPVPMEAFCTASPSEWFFAWPKAVWQSFKI
jgi:hypothetical protein